MKKEYEYLSDEELNKLIADVETEGLAVAPESIEDKVFSYVDRKEQKNSQRTKKADFYRYCFKVWGAVAAAILLLVLLPAVRGPRESFASREDVISRKETPTREEYLSQNKAEDRDEVLSGRSSDGIHKLQEAIESKIAEFDM